MMPSKSVSELMSLERFENSVPRLEMAVSWLSNVVNWVFQGVSTFCRLLTIDATVELTSKPAPLVGDPKFNPTVPIASSTENSCSRGTTAAEAHWENLIDRSAINSTLPAN